MVDVYICLIFIRKIRFVCFQSEKVFKGIAETIYVVHKQIQEF
jgi:hypothetical protein